MTRKEEKQQLRKLIRAMERELPQSYKDQASAAICAHLAAMPEYQAADTVFAFVGTIREIDTTAFLEDVLRRGKRLCVPLCVGDGLMEGADFVLFVPAPALDAYRLSYFWQRYEPWLRADE